MNDAHSPDDLIAPFSAQFGREPMAVAHAHGRANLIGEHTDYNDGLVLPCLISNRTEVALAMRNDDLVCGISNQFPAGQKAVHDKLDGHWLDFVIGALHQLLPVGGGFRVLILPSNPTFPQCRCIFFCCSGNCPTPSIVQRSNALRDGYSIGPFCTAD